MADYYPLLARALDALPDRSPGLRRAVYDRARNALVSQLRSLEPPLSEDDIDLERRALDTAIERLEVEHGGIPAPANDAPPKVTEPRKAEPAKPEATKAEPVKAEPLPPPPEEPVLPAPPPAPSPVPEPARRPHRPVRSSPHCRNHRQHPRCRGAGPSNCPGAVSALQSQARGAGRVPGRRRSDYRAQNPRGWRSGAPEPVGPRCARDPETDASDDAGANGDAGQGRQRPRIEVVAPRGRSRILRNLAIGIVLIAVIGAIAVAAFLLRDTPQNLVRSEAEPTQQAVDGSAEAKFGDGWATSRPRLSTRSAEAPAGGGSCQSAGCGGSGGPAERRRGPAGGADRGVDGTGFLAAHNQPGRVTWRIDTANGEQGQPCRRWRWRSSTIRMPVCP